MKKLYYLSIYFFVLAFFHLSGMLQAQNLRNLEDLLIYSEQHPEVLRAAKEKSRELHLPSSILLEDLGIFMEVKAVTEGTLLYAVYRNFAHPLTDGSVMTYEEIQRHFDLSSARMRYFTPQRHRNGLKDHKQTLSYQELLLIPETTTDAIMAFDPMTGDLVDSAFFSAAGNVSLPIEIHNTAWGTFTISDQTADVVHEFDINGNYLGVFAPTGGPDPSILDNIRGHTYHPITGHLLVTVASGTNSDAVAEFDTAGNYLGNFISNGLGGLDSPWSIWFRSNDVLVTGISSDNIIRYDLDGNFLSVFAPVNSFPEQVVEIANGEVAVGNFSGQSGVVIFSADGTLLDILSGVTGNRGVWQLGNGNILTTNSTGVHEIDRNTGNLVRTIIAGVSSRHITLYSAGGVPGFNLASNSLDFGIVEVGTSVSDSVAVHNPGTATLDITAVTSDNTSFMVTPSSAAIAPGDSFYFVITYSPTDTLPDVGHIIFEHNAPTSPDTLDVQGIGGLAMFSVSPTVLVFDSVSTNSSVTDSVLISNSGNVDLIISTATTDNPAFTVQPNSGNIPPGGSAYFRVTFNADSLPGVVTGNLVFTHNAPSSPDTVMLQAEVITGIFLQSTLPGTYYLAQNYPNPFNPVTQIGFRIANFPSGAGAFVKLAVYDLLGRKVKTLVNKSLTPGEYQVQWDGKDENGKPVVSGVYLYRLQAGDFVQVRKMVLLR
ncbi:MAG: choice-of-anchor D domain-containing protein [Calditrichaeota bacterium]|nr:MAG: choice-of-anchor D domain-containing protein [Calditrichota bacterium]